MNPARCIQRHRSSVSRWAVARRALRVSLLIVLAAGCVPLEQLPVDAAEYPFTISMITPSEDTFIRPEETVRIRWIDEGMEPGALVYLKSVSTDEKGDQAEVDILARRDAVEDGSADIYDWNGTDSNGFPLPARRYEIFGVLENPDGRQDVRALAGKIVIPFNFVGLGAGGNSGILSNNSGAGPFILQDNDADFVSAGVAAGRTLRVFGGSGSIVGNYVISGVTQTRLTLRTDAGDSGGENDVRYLAIVDNPALADVEGLVTIGWQDAEFATNSTITLEVDSDTNADNENETVIRESIDLGQDGERDNFAWDGTDTDGFRVPPGQYYARARLNPGTANELTYLTSSRVTVGGVGPTIHLLQPALDVSPDAGATVDITWTDSDPDDDATITLLVDPDDDIADPTHDSGNEIIIETGISEDDSADSYSWVTAGTPEGEYSVVGRIEDSAGSSAVSSADGRVTLGNSPPVLEWVRPEGDAADADDNNQNGPFVLIDSAANFTSSYGGNAAVRNLVFPDNLVRIQKDTDGVFVGAYPVSEVLSATRVEMSSNPGDSDDAGDVEYRITGDINLTRGTNPVFDFRAHDPEDTATLDLYLDFDDDRENGNEIQILQGPDGTVPNETEPQDDAFTWTGTVDVDLNTVDPGNYRLFAEMDDGNVDNQGTTVEFEGRLLLRTGDGEPTITMTAPATETVATVGQPVEITWDDEDTEGGATITLIYDDDAAPNEATETDDAETQIEAGIDADLDEGDPGVGGNPDRRLWDWHPTDITRPAVGEGTYYIFGYIGDNGNPLTAPDMIAVAPGPVVIPNTPPELEFTGDVTTIAELPSPGGGEITWNQRDPDDGDTVSVDLWLTANNVVPQFESRKTQIENNHTGGGDPYVWDGEDRFGNPVETGQYRIFAVLNEDSDNTTESPGLVNIRPDIDTAVINMASQYDELQSATQGGTVDIKWRAALVFGDEVVELYYDDDASNADDLGTLIEGSLSHDPNTLNSYTWEVETSVPVHPGYRIHARLLMPDMPADTDADVSTAAQRLVDTNADFVAAGVIAGDKVRIFSGGGTTSPGLYTVANVAQTWLDLSSDPGDSGSAGDVAYSVGELDVSTSKGTLEVNTDIFPLFDFVLPVAPVDVVSGVDTVDIRWDYTSGEPGTILIRADPDTRDRNGNEITILSNRPQPAAPDGAEDSLDWDLTDSSGTDVPTGKYLLRGAFAPGSSEEIRRTAEGAVRIRKSATAPLVSLTLPTVVTTLNEGDPSGAVVQIAWEVNDPDGSSPKVDLWYDEDQSPEPSAGNLAEGADLSTLSGSAGAIAEDLDASVSVLLWEVPAELTANTGTYYIHIRIRDGALPADDDRDTAPAGIVVR